MERFGGPEAVFEAAQSELEEVEALTERGRSKILGPAPAAIERDIKIIEDRGLVLTTVRSPDYPGSLKAIFDPPVLLYSMGGVMESDKLSIAIVGSRRATSMAGRWRSE